MDTVSIIDGDYRKWVEDLGKRFRQSQLKAAVSVKTKKLARKFADKNKIRIFAV